MHPTTDAAIPQPPPTTPDPHPDPRAVLRTALSAESAARAWLDDALDRVAADPAAIRALFPAARRRCGGGGLDSRWTVDEAARAALLAALPLGGAELADEVTTLFRNGDPAEQRAVLRALPLIEPRGAALLPLVHEALRGNDNALIEAALGPYAAARLTDDDYRQAVLKCVFYEVPLGRVTGLADRADTELARMLVDFAHERVAAGRDVPENVWPVVRAFPAASTARLTAEAHSPVPDRRRAATRALAALAGAEPLSRATRPTSRRETRRETRRESRRES